MTSRQAEEAATAHGLESMGLHRFSLQARDHKGLLLGFGAFDEKTDPASCRYAYESAALVASRRLRKMFTLRSTTTVLNWKHCPSRVTPGIGQTLKVVLFDRLHFCGCRSHAVR
jgi:hypothetical protein